MREGSGPARRAGALAFTRGRVLTGYGAGGSTTTVLSGER
jgi:hypothetical protein